LLFLTYFIKSWVLYPFYPVSLPSHSKLSLKHIFLSLLLKHDLHGKCYSSRGASYKLLLISCKGDG
jgi:hypothetical protein